MVEMNYEHGGPPGAVALYIQFEQCGEILVACVVKTNVVSVEIGGKQSYVNLELLVNHKMHL